MSSPALIEDPLEPSVRRTSARHGRTLARALALAVLALASAALLLRHLLVASLPQLDGERRVAGLSAPVVVERDALGVPSLRAASRADAARGLGFLHGQDRFFQMDLLRRRAAGELSERFGPAALKLDRAVRVHRLRWRAERSFAETTPEQRALLEAYAGGVNAGLRALGAWPFEYQLLRGEPRPWLPEDSFLVGYAMFLDLNDEDGARESMLHTLHETLPLPVYEFLAPHGTEWDAPNVGGLAPAVAVPGPEVLDLRAAAKADVPPPLVSRRAARDEHDPGEVPEPERGSNSWVVDGAHSANGGALVANDPHLGLNVPNIWYRASLEWPATQGGGARRVIGSTLPGMPMVVLGSNTKVAWGFTNTTGDWSDLVIVELQADGETYATPEGPRKLTHAVETIEVKGQPDERLDVRETIWGPIVRKDARGRPLAVRWIAHDPEAVRLNFSELERADDVDQALRAAAGIGAPPQNFVCADTKGRIGWTVLGRIPRRKGFDGRLPGSWADGSRRWEGWLDAAEYPRIVDPAQGRIWTANARIVDGSDLAKIGEGGGYAFGARQRQIRDDLLAIEKATPRDMLGVQLDNRAVFLGRWREVLLATLGPEAIAKDARRAELRGHVESWGGRASSDSVGYRAVRAFRLALSRLVLPPLSAACRAKDPDFDYLGQAHQWEAPLWSLVRERPLHLLDPTFASWDEALLAAADRVIEDFTKDGGRIADRTWGEANTARIQHSLSRAIPRLAPWLDMPRDPLPGDSNMPRVLASASGASLRFVVSPGREAEGIFQMPGGQSGHPLSEYYRKGHEAWVRGEESPFLPGPAAHTLTLKP